VTIECVSSGQNDMRWCTYTRCCLLAVTAEDSIVFTRWCQRAHPTTILFLEPAWVSPLNGISVCSAVFWITHPGRRAGMFQSYSTGSDNVHPGLTDGVNVRQHAKFMKTGRTVAVRHLGLIVCLFGPPMRTQDLSMASKMPTTLPKRLNSASYNIMKIWKMQ